MKNYPAGCSERTTWEFGRCLARKISRDQREIKQQHFYARSNKPFMNEKL
jgi:hypothetical protein